MGSVTEARTAHLRAAAESACGRQRYRLLQRRQHPRASLFWPNRMVLAVGPSALLQDRLGVDPEPLGKRCDQDFDRCSSVQTACVV
jgi:hypothetical protein